MEQTINKIAQSCESGEAQLLRGIIADSTGKILDSVYSAGVQPETFFSPGNQYLYDAILTIVIDKQGHLNPVAIADQLTKQGLEAGIEVKAESIGMDYALSLAEVLVELQQKRRLKMVVGSMSIEMQATEETAFELMSRFSSTMSDAIIPPVDELSDMQLVQEVIDEVHKASETGVSQIGIQTNYDKFDRNHGGYEEAGYYVIKGEPASGKTSFMRTLVKQITLAGIKVDVYSLEQTRKMFLSCLTSQIAGFNLFQGRLGRNPPKQGQLENALGVVMSLPLKVFDQSFTPDALRAHVRRRVEREGTQIIFLDYLQAMRMNPGVKDIITHIEQCTSTLRQIAKDYKIPVVVISTSNKDGGERYSGQIKYDAFGIVNLRKSDNWTHEKREVILEVEKNRFGISDVQIPMILYDDGNMLEDMY